MVLDALPSLLALEEAGLLDALPPIAPPLKPWRRELIRLLLGREGAVRELKAPVVRLGQAAYATSMDHFLHAPTALLERMRARVLSRVGPSPIRAERVYLSRRSHAHPMRVCLNEAELERALAARGFAIVRPEKLSPGAQIALARQARIIVGPTGAGMANALFAEPGATVIDIQPQVFPSAWVPAFGERIGHDWRVYHAPAPADVADVPWVRRARRGFRFAFHVPLDDFLPYLDGALA
jgi:capsular polysaccharide biosynthesis protein